MADRLNQYPVLSNPFNPTLLQQQAQLDNQSTPTFASPEQSRMWHNVQSQMQPQFNPQVIPAPRFFIPNSRSYPY